MRQFILAIMAVVMLSGTSFGQVKIKEIFVPSPTYPDNPTQTFEKSGIKFSNLLLDQTNFPEQKNLSKITEAYSEYHKEVKNGIVYIFHFLIKKDNRKVIRMEVWSDNVDKNRIITGNSTTAERGRHCEDKPSDTGVIICLINEFLASISW